MLDQYIATMTEKHAQDNELSYKEELGREVLDRYCEMTEAFEQKGLRSFAMKTFRSYPYADKDIDIILVDKNKLKRYAEVLNRLGYKFKWNISMVREPGKRFFVRMDPGGADTIPIAHVHFAVSWNGTVYLDAAKVWERLVASRIMGRAIKTPSAEDELLIMAAHSMHENSYITAGELLHISNIIAQDRPIDADYMIGASRGYGWLDSLRCYYSYAHCWYLHLTGKELFPAALRDKLRIDTAAYAKDMALKDGSLLFIPTAALARAYLSKIFKDIFSTRVLGVPRELLTFGLVIWLYRRKKKAKLSKSL